MDATSGIALVLQLARDGVSLLESAVACKRQAARLQRALSQFAPRLEQLRETDLNVAQLEAELRSLLDLLKPYFGDTARSGLAAKTLLLFQVKAIRQALAKAEQHLQTCLQLCQLDRQPGQLRGLWQSRTAARLAEEAKDDEDARNELQRLLETLQRRGLLNSASEEILSLLQENPDMDAGALFEGRLGTRRQRRALGRLTTSLTRAEEVEAASLGRDQVFIKSPLQVLGEGQFGQVVLGVLRRDDGSEVETAIKRVNPDGRGMQFWEQQALMREAASLNGLKHANIVCLLGTCILQNRFHLVMDKCDMSLYDLLYQGEADAMSALTLDDKEAILRGIARGLDYLHGKSVLHRDLKPANILLNHNLGLVKLADFGLATQLEANSSVANTVSFAGTPVYMAPEVLQVPARWTTRADVYAFGIVMWEVYHGRSPFARVRSIMDLQTRVLNGERPIISDEIVVRPWVVPLIQRCWEHDPENRPLASELLKIFEGRKNVRRSARLIRGMVSVFSRRRNGQNVAESTSTELVQSLAREVSQKSDRLSQALDALREILEQEYHAGDGDVVRADVRSRGIILSMKRLLEHDTDVNILTKALWVLRFALSGATGRPFRMAAVHSHGLDKIVVNMFQAFREHEDLQGAACGFVMVVANASDANGVSLVQEMKIGDEIVAAMRAHCTSETVQTEACGALWHLAENLARNMEILGQELRVGRDIAEAMRSHPGSRTVQTNACGALWVLAINSRNRIILGQRLRVGSYIVRAMRAHRTSVKVQQNACKALWKLAGNTNNRVILGQELNAGQAIVAAMRRHPMNEGVQNFACSALSDLAGNARNRVILGQKLNAGEVIMAAMCAHSRSAIVREKACAALSALAIDGRNKVILGQELKVGKEIAKAMREHRTREGVQKNACRAIGALAWDSHNREILAQEVKVGEEIVVAMRSHAAKKVVQTHACEAICSLALSERNKVILGQELNVGKYIAEAMRAHRRCERVQQEACRALQILALNDRNETILAQEFKVGKEIAAAMRANYGNASVQENACGALWTLSFKSRNKTILGQEVMVGKEIVMAMRTHPWSEGLQKKACGALNNLAFDSTVRSVLRRQGAVQAVQRTCQRFPSLQTAKEARARLSRGNV